MNPVLVDPDVKINMSLDEIIQLSRGQINNNLPGRRMRRKKKHPKRTVDGGGDHSVPLLSSTSGVGIYVSRKSSLLSADHRRWIAKAISNRAMNCDLLKKSKVVIPAEYKIFRTDQGVERVLVPTEEHSSMPKRQKLLPPRKLNKIFTCNESLPDGPPPLVSAPIYSPTLRENEEAVNMDVDGPDDDIIILDVPESKKQINVQLGLPVDVIEAKRMCVTAQNFGHNSVVKTLSERFTMLTGSFQF